jgi:hypothetical protein
MAQEIVKLNDSGYGRRNSRCDAESSRLNHYFLPIELLQPQLNYAAAAPSGEFGFSTVAFFIVIERYILLLYFGYVEECRLQFRCGPHVDYLS